MAPKAGGPGSIPGQGTRSHTHAAAKSLHATTKDPIRHNEDPARGNKDPQLRPGAAKLINKYFFLKNGFGVGIR